MIKESDNSYNYHTELVSCRIPIKTVSQLIYICLDVWQRGPIIILYQQIVLISETGLIILHSFGVLGIIQAKGLLYFHRTHTLATVQEDTENYHHRYQRSSAHCHLG